MATCKNCLYEPKCISRVLHGMGTNDVTGEDATNMETCCADFKDKSLCIELPCKLSGKIYIIVTKRPRVYCEEFNFIKVSELTYNNLERVVKDFGKTVFLSREDAERALIKIKKENEEK